MQDPRALKRFFAKEEIRELPSEEELWEVPEPHKPDIPPERGTEDTWWKKHTHSHPVSHEMLDLHKYQNKSVSQDNSDPLGHRGSNLLEKQRNR